MDSHRHKWVPKGLFYNREYERVIIAYSPIWRAEEREIMSCDHNVDRALSNIPKIAKIFLADFNSRFGWNAELGRCAVDMEGLKKLGSNCTLSFKNDRHDLVNKTLSVSSTGQAEVIVVSGIFRGLAHHILIVVRKMYCRNFHAARNPGTSALFHRLLSQSGGGGGSLWGRHQNGARKRG